MKWLMMVISVLTVVVINGEYRISDRFIDGTETYENWNVRREISKKAIVTDAVVKDSLEIKMVSLDGDSESSVVFFNKLIGLDTLIKIEKVKMDVHFKTGFPIYADRVGKERYFEFQDLRIMQSYNDYWSNEVKYAPGYYIVVKGQAISVIRDNSPLDFEIELTVSVDTFFTTPIPLYRYRIVAFKNGEKIAELSSNEYLEFVDFVFKTCIEKSLLLNGQIYEDKEAGHEIKIDDIIVYPDYNAIEITKTDYIWGYTESEQSIDVKIVDSYTGEKCRGSEVEIETGEGKVYRGVTDDNGEVIISGITTMSDSDLKLIISKSEEFYKYEGNIDVRYYIFNVSHQRDLPVLKNIVNRITVTESNAIEGIFPVSGALVEITNGEDYVYSGLTNQNGIYEVSTYLTNNKKIELKVTKDRYKTYTGMINPYLWSNTQDAFGKNNQEHIVRKPNTDEMEMVYTTGEDVVYGRSEDFGKIWELEVLGSGVDPVLVRTGSGLIAIWRNGISSYSYAIKSSPWTPSDTLVNPVIWLSEPVLGYNYTAGRTYIGYINNRYLQMERGDYILASMEELNTDDIYYDTVVSYRGEYNKVPMKSPVYSLYYNQLERNISHLIGFIDTSFQYVVSRYNIETKKWSDFEILNNLGQRCNAPVADYYGEVTTFGYEVMNVDNTRDIWVVKMVDGVIGTPERVNIYSGLNRNPKVRNNYLVSYVNNYNKIISQPGYGLTSLQNVVVLSGDSIYSYEVNMKETLLSKKALFAWTEGSNGEYRIKMKEVQYKGEVVPYIVSEPQDTIERVVTTPLYEYIPYKVPVERLNTTIDGLNPEMSYTIKVLTSDNNPVMAQVIEIDGEVYGVVRGGANRVDTTEIILPKEVYGDKRVVVSIDRKKGNPNRVAEVIVYQYEREGGVIATGNEKEIIVSVVNNDETEKKTKHVFTGKDEVYIDYLSSGVKDIEIEVYDVRGGMIKDWRREVKVGFNRVLLNGIENAGIYFVVIKSGGSKEIRKISIIK